MRISIRWQYLIILAIGAWLISFVGSGFWATQRSYAQTYTPEEQALLDRMGHGEPSETPAAAPTPTPTATPTTTPAPDPGAQETDKGRNQRSDSKKSKQPASSRESFRLSDGSYGYARSGARGLVQYNQNQKPWRDAKFCPASSKNGPRTFKSSACGAASLAMVGATLKGRRSITPVTIARKYCQRTLTGGSVSWISGTDLIKRAGEEMGLPTSYVGRNLNALEQALPEGALGIASFDGGGRFAVVGHYLVIRAVTPDGRFWLSDPNGKGKKKPNGKGHYNNEARPFSAKELRENGLYRVWIFERPR